MEDEFIIYTFSGGPGEYYTRYRRPAIKYTHTVRESLCYTRTGGTIKRYTNLLEDQVYSIQALVNRVKCYTLLVGRVHPPPVLEGLPRAAYTDWR